jgi:4-diphosphocytidyl-2-C-methyl-D-erythritol kinase
MRFIAEGPKRFENTGEKSFATLIIDYLYNHASMSVGIPSFAKINLGLRIGPLRSDGFHELRTVYQTVALHDLVRVSVGRGTGIKIRCDDPRVPCDRSNTCYKIAERAVEALKMPGRVEIEIEKRLPVQGGLGGASANAVAAMLALERAAKKPLDPAERLRIAAEVGSDLPLFLIGGTVLGVARGEEVYPLPDLPPTPCVVALPEIPISTPRAFRDWDAMRSICTKPNPWHPEPTSEGQEPSMVRKKQVPQPRRSSAKQGLTSFGMTDLKQSIENKNAITGRGLTYPAPSDRMLWSSREISAWLAAAERGRRSGVSAKGGGRAESPLLDLVRAGIENDFEEVVFSQHPELCEVKRVLERSGSQYASLSGSGSAVYGLFASRETADAARKKLAVHGTRAVVTATLTRRLYWRRLLAVGA